MPEKRDSPQEQLTKKTPRVLFVSHTANTGCGAENCLNNLLSGFAGRSLRPMVAVPENGGSMEEALADLSIPVLRTPIEWWIGSREQLERFPQGWTGRVKAMTELIRHHHVDLVVTNTSVILEGALAASLAGVPHVWYVHEMLSLDPHLTAPHGPARAYGFMNEFSALMVTVADSVRREILGLCPEARVEVVHTGMDVRCGRSPEDCRSMVLENTSFSRDDIIACFMGVLSERKGVTMLVDVAETLRRDHPDLRYVMVGPDGGKEPELRRAIADRGLEDVFHLAGRSEAPLEWINGADILLLPSLVDPFPLVLHEAMHLGVPVVATRSGGAPEIVVHGETGHLVEPGDADGFSRALADLAVDAPRRKRLGRNGLERARNDFSRRAYVDGFCAMLEQGMAASPAVMPERGFPDVIHPRITREGDH